jgi:hypothetical protein
VEGNFFLISVVGILLVTMKGIFLDGASEGTQGARAGGKHESGLVSIALIKFFTLLMAVPRSLSWNRLKLGMKKLVNLPASSALRKFKINSFKKLY